MSVQTLAPAAAPLREAAPARLYIGTSGWHYDDWRNRFYPPEITGYNELRFYAAHFNTVENNSSFYRIAQESTYKTWFRMTPADWKFSIKLNKAITHIHRLAINEDVHEKVNTILTSTQVLQQKVGAIVIQLPPSFRVDLDKLTRFLAFFTEQVRAQVYPFDVAIEFRNQDWFTDETYALLRHYNVALVAAQSSRYPGERQVTGEFAYIRMHGPERLFASKYTLAQLEEWATYINTISAQVKRIYVYFNNDFYGYALENAKELIDLAGAPDNQPSYPDPNAGSHRNRHLGPALSAPVNRPPGQSPV
jgi:uncharacterized protein YecE (DUF72 family)